MNTSSSSKKQEDNGILQEYCYKITQTLCYAAILKCCNAANSLSPTKSLQNNIFYTSFKTPKMH